MFNKYLLCSKRWFYHKLNQFRSSSFSVITTPKWNMSLRLPLKMIYISCLYPNTVKRKGLFPFYCDNVTITHVHACAHTLSLDRGSLIPKYSSIPKYTTPLHPLRVVSLSDSPLISNKKQPQLIKPKIWSIGH